MRRAIFCATAIALSLTGACRTATDSRVARQLDALFADLHQRGLFNGAVVVGAGDRIVWEKGFGFANVERGVAFTPDTPADGASLAKTFTAALVNGLADEGVLDLDASAQRLLPELPYPGITLRHLLSHSSGIAVLDYDYFDRFVPPGQVRTTEVLLNVLAARKPPLAFAPGSAFEYSSFGYDLAALAAARAVHQPLDVVLRQRIFAPLAIESAFLRPGRLTDFPGVRTLGYRGAEVNDVFDLEAFHGGSNIYISARDLHRWNLAFLRGDLRSRDLARIAGAPSGLTLGSWYRSADGGSFSYAGHLQGFHGEVFRDVRLRRSVVYVSNNTLEPWLQHGIVNAVKAILDGRHVAPLMPPAVDDIRKEERAALAGRWRMSGGEAITIEHRDHLTMMRNGVAYRMVQVRPAFFYIPGLDFVVGFAKAPNGTPSRVFVSTNFSEEWGVRATP